MPLQSPPAIEHRVEHAPIHSALGWMFVGQAADVATTVYGLKHGAREANPLYGRQPTATRVIATKAVVLVPLAWAIDRLYPSHPKLARGLAYVLAGIGGGAAASNIHQLRK